LIYFHNNIEYIFDLVSKEYKSIKIDTNLEIESLLKNYDELLKNFKK